MTNHSKVTIVTVAVVVLWIVSKIWQPLGAVSVLDSLMPIVVSGWFAYTAATAVKKNGGAT